MSARSKSKPEKKFEIPFPICHFASGLDAVAAEFHRKAHSYAEKYFLTNTPLYAVKSARISSRRNIPHCDNVAKWLYDGLNGYIEGNGKKHLDHHLKLSLAHGGRRGGPFKQLEKIEGEMEFHFCVAKLIGICKRRRKGKSVSVMRAVKETHRRLRKIGKVPTSLITSDVKLARRYRSGWKYRDPQTGKLTPAFKFYEELAQEAGKKQTIEYVEDSRKEVMVEMAVVIADERARDKELTAEEAAARVKPGERWTAPIEVIADHYRNWPDRAECEDVARYGEKTDLKRFYMETNTVKKSGFKVIWDKGYQGKMNDEAYLKDA